MPEQLTTSTDNTRGRPWLIGALPQVGVVLAIFAIGGALAGVVWEWIWTPPSGVVFRGEWLLDPEQASGDFSATGIYVVVASIAGLLLGALCGLVVHRRELLTLASVIAGAALAAWLMLRVGQALGPPDPRPLAASAKELSSLPSDLRVVGKSPLVALPSGALLGLIVVLFGLSRRSRH